MNVKLLSIESAKELGKFNLSVQLGTEENQFTMMVESDTIAGESFEVIKGDEEFHCLFKFNQEIAVKLYKLLAKFKDGEALELPVDLGNFSRQEVTRVPFDEKEKLAYETTR